MRRRILTVIGTRPNYIKVTQFEKEFAKYPDDFEYRLLHTGQHYDASMADIFFKQLKLKKIDYALGIHTGSPAQQIGNIIVKMEEVLREWKPDLVIVVGDVNSTLAAAIAANKAGVKLAHVESGLRSYDRTMPEEFNRILTDEVTDIFFVTEKSGKENLLKEGKQESAIFSVGNTMIDTIVAFDKEIDHSAILEKLSVEKEKYILITMHRPSNVDDPESLAKVFDLIDLVTEKYQVVFPIHPRTRGNISKFNLNSRLEKNEKLILTEPLDYFSFQKLIKDCKLVITDSGGIQEETTFRKTPCLTLRDNTERPITIELGTNEMIHFDVGEIRNKIQEIERGTFKKGAIPPLWDGKATERIVKILKEL